MPETRNYIVPESAAGERLDVWLSGLAQEGTRSQVALAIADGNVSVDGEPAKASRRLRGGENVSVEARRVEPPRDTPAQAIPLDFLYVDDTVIAVNKAPGVVVHPAAGNRDGTLVNALLHAFPGACWPGSAERAGIVHRLDKDTSGVILIARTVEAHEALSRQFRRREIHKTYLALVRGAVREAGSIDDPIGRHPRDRKRMSTAARSGRSASTGYEPVECYEAATLLTVRPKTGRTHQIRVHLAARGWPIVADPVYGAMSARSEAAFRARWGRVALALQEMPRQALHAQRIRFLHPVSGQAIELEAPLPPDLRSVIERLRAAAGK